MLRSDSQFLGDRGAQCGAAPRPHKQVETVAPTDATVLIYWRDRDGQRTDRARHP